MQIKRGLGYKEGSVLLVLLVIFIFIFLMYDKNIEVDISDMGSEIIDEDSLRNVTVSDDVERVPALSRCQCDRLQPDGRFTGTASCSTTDWREYGGLRILEVNPETNEITYSCLGVNDYSMIGERNPLLESASDLSDRQVYRPNALSAGGICYTQIDSSITEVPGLFSPTPILIFEAVLSDRGIYTSDGLCVTQGPIVTDSYLEYLYSDSSEATFVYYYGGYGTDYVGWQCWEDVQDMISGMSPGYVQNHNGEFFCNTCDGEYVLFSLTPSTSFELTGCQLPDGEGYCALVSVDARMHNYLETTIVTDEFKILVDESGVVFNGRFRSYPACISRQGNNVIALFQNSRGMTSVPGSITFAAYGFREGIEVQNGEFSGYFVDNREGACGYDVAGYDDWSMCVTGVHNVQMPVKDGARSYRRRESGNYALERNIFPGDRTDGGGLNCIDFSREIGSGAPEFYGMVNGALTYKDFEAGSGVVCSQFFSDVPVNINPEVFDEVT